MDQFAWTPVNPPPVPPPLPVKPEFSGHRRPFVGLLLRGTGLELVTLGFYRFWLVTDVRRHLWSNTVIDGDAAEYTGRGKELLIGFLIALAILVPIYLGYFLIGIEVERWKALASFPLIAAFYVFGQFAIYRARRYRLTRTVWRGVRFWMDGSGWAYAARATLWSLLSIVTLGISIPWRLVALERYKMRHSWYGDLQGDFEGRGWDLFKKIWWIWLLLALFVFSVVSPVVFRQAWGAQTAGVMLFVITLAIPFLYPYYKAVEWHWWVSGIRFGEVRLQSTLAPSALQGLYWKVIGWSLLFGMAFSMLLGGVSWLIMRSGLVTGVENVMQRAPMLAVTILGYLLLALSFGLVSRLYLTRDLWVRVLATTEITGLETAADVAVRGGLASALGEGFADGLDVAGF